MRLRWAGHVARMAGREIHVGFWWGKPEGRRPHGQPVLRSEDNIQMDLKSYLV